MKEHGLRDLARKLMAEAERHPNYNQAISVLQNMESHLTAMAAYFEGIDREHEMSREMDKVKRG